MNHLVAYNALKKLMTLTILLLPSFGIYAELTDSENIIQESESRIENLANQRNKTIDDIEQNLKDLESERIRLQALAAEQAISIEDLEVEYKLIEEKYLAINSEYDAISDKKEKIINEYRLYKHQETAKIFAPMIVGIAVLLSTSDSSDRIVNGFAGFGAVSALEELGLGLGKPIGKLTFKLFEW